MLKLGRKGQMNNSIVSAMILVVIVGFIGVISITIYDDIDDSMVNTASTTTAKNTIGNFTDNVYDGYDLAANIPIVLAAALIITVVLGMAMVVRG